MQILERPEKDLKKELKKYVLEYVKNNPFFKAKKITRDFILLHLKTPKNSKEYTNLCVKLRCSLNQLIYKLINESIITVYNTQSYKINKGMKNFDEKLEVIRNSINKGKIKTEGMKRDEKGKLQKITEKTSQEDLKDKIDEIKELYNKNIGVPNIFNRCCKTTIYNRFKKIGVKNYGLNEHEDEDEFLQFLNKEYFNLK